MAKMKTTAKQLKQSFSNYKQIKTSYCKVQYLVADLDPDFYTVGVYGWNFDAYVFHDNKVIITTGYRGMFGDQVNYEIVESFEKQAREICSKTWKYEERHKLLHNLRQEFFKAIQ